MASTMVRGLVALAAATGALGTSLRHETARHLQPDMPPLLPNPLPDLPLPGEGTRGRRLSMADSPLSVPHKSNPDQDAIWWVLAHNQLRCYHGLGEVQWHSQAAGEMQAYVDWMEDTNVWKHWSQAGQPFQGAPLSGIRGENLISYAPAIEVQIQRYYDEIRDCATMPGCKVSNIKTKSWYEVGHLRAILNPNMNRIGCACARTCGCRMGYEGDGSDRVSWDGTLNAVDPNLVVGCDTKFKRLYEQAGNAVAWTPFQHIPHYRDTYDTSKVLTLPEPEKRTFPGCVDKANYRDDSGNTCEDYYARFSNACTDYGDKWHHMGKPNDSCCACAYKLAPTSSPTRSPTPAAQCEDNASWYFGGSATFDCAWISASEARCSTYGGWRGQEGQTGNEECCKCKWLADGNSWQDVLDLAAGNTGSSSTTDHEQCEDVAGFYYYAPQFGCSWFATDAASRCGVYGSMAWPDANGKPNDKCCACKNLL